MHGLVAPLFESKKTIFWFLFYLCLYVYVCLGIHTYVQIPWRPEGASEPFSLELQVVMSHKTWV